MLQALACRYSSMLLSGVREKRLCSCKADERWKCRHFPAKNTVPCGVGTSLLPRGTLAPVLLFPSPALPWQSRLCGIRVPAHAQPGAAEIGPGYFPRSPGWTWPWACSPPVRGNVVSTATSWGARCREYPNNLLIWPCLLRSHRSSFRRAENTL